jgi:hypothetical protein
VVRLSPKIEPFVVSHGVAVVVINSVGQHFRP